MDVRFHRVLKQFIGGYSGLRRGTGSYTECWMGVEGVLKIAISHYMRYDYMCAL